MILWWRICWWRVSLVNWSETLLSSNKETKPLFVNEKSITLIINLILINEKAIVPSFHVQSLVKLFYISGHSCLFVVSIQHQYKHFQWFPCCCCWSSWLWKVHAAVSSSWRNRKTARECLCKGKVLSSEFVVSQVFSCCFRKMFCDKQHPTLKALLLTIDRYLYTAAFWGWKRPCTKVVHSNRHSENSN